MVTAGKTYIVEDADKDAEPHGVPVIYPGSLQGLLDAHPGRGGNHEHDRDQLRARGRRG